MRLKQRGFTLVELLIVLVIVSILAAVAIPSYQHYLKRARFSEVIMASTPYKTAVALALQDGELIKTLNSGQGDIPNSPPSTENLKSIKVKKGVVTATATDRAGGYTYILTPNPAGTQWAISGTCIKAHACKGS